MKTLRHNDYINSQVYYTDDSFIFQDSFDTLIREAETLRQMLTPPHRHAATMGFYYYLI